MYQLSVAQWNPWVGCEYDCLYCRKSFQAQLKRRKHQCQDCYDYTPHGHPERLAARLPRTGYGQFIFTCASGDITTCPDNFLHMIVNRIKAEPDKTFLIQSKNPETFNRIRWPKNVLLGTTIETNYSTHEVSNAPSPGKRARDFELVDHPFKMVTIEPVMEFDFGTMVHFLVERIRPCLVWIGYDTKGCDLPEPDGATVRKLAATLQEFHIPVLLKAMR